MKPNKTKSTARTAEELRDEMKLFGAQFEFSRAGSLWVRGLGSLPPYLLDEFLMIEQKPFVAAVRALPCPAEARAR